MNKTKTNKLIKWLDKQTKPKQTEMNQIKINNIDWLHKQKSMDEQSKQRKWLENKHTNK